MEQTLFFIGIASGVLGVGFLIAAIAMFFGYKIPTLWKDMKGTLEQKHIEEIRQKNSDAASQKGKVNVFEELERKAKVKKPNTHSLNLATTGFIGKPLGQNSNQETSVLQVSSKAVNPDFIIEKDIIFVSTNEVI